MKIPILRGIEVPNPPFLISKLVPGGFLGVSEAKFRSNATSILQRTGQNAVMLSREQKSDQGGSGEIPTTATDTRKKILFIDDDPVTLKALTNSLNGKGFEVFSAPDGSAAIGVVRDEIPDLLLVDVNFTSEDTFGAAGSWDGFQVTRWLRYMSARKIPAIMMSATDREDYKEYAERIDAEAFMAKPLSSEKLFRSIEAALA